MSMVPLFPSLRPSVGSSICIDADTPCDEEAELRETEKEHVAWVRSTRMGASSQYYQCVLFQLKTIQQTAIDLSPFGKVPPVGTDPDTDDEGMCIARNECFPLNN